MILTKGVGDLTAMSDTVRADAEVLKKQITNKNGDVREKMLLTTLKFSLLKALSHE